MSVVLDPPRWKGGPPICPIANLPAFPTWEEAKAFLDYHGGFEDLKWQCRCGNWHFWAHPYAPSGATSGTARSALPIPQRIILLSKNLL